MNSSVHELRSRLEKFSLDDPAATISFSQRLARENGWSSGFARRAIEEYKRFVLLTQMAGHPVCPSEQVDQVWHQHLTFTKSYWDEFCPKVLGRPLHHVPTQGGPQEHAKHVAMYEATLASYRRIFGHEPPADIWPPAAIRFGEDVDCRRVNLREHWVVPKPHRWWKTVSDPLAKSGLLLAPAVAIVWNPLNWHGPEFLALYWFCLVTFLVFAYFSKRADRDVPWINPRTDLHPYEIACLTQNPKAVVNAALAKLMQAKIVRLASEPVKKGWVTIPADRFAVSGTLPSDSHPVEKTIVETVQILGENTTHSEILKSGSVPALNVRQSLIDEGLALDSTNRRGVGLLPFSLLMALFGFGLTKILVGISRERPVFFLIASCAVTVVAAVVCLVFPVRRSLMGDRVVKDLRKRFRPLLYQEKRSLDIAPDRLALAVAIFGATALIGSPVAALHPLVQRTEAATNGISGGGCGSSGCGGSGCGGGGCGGGGCGGCGGGGGD